MSGFGIPHRLGRVEAGPANYAATNATVLTAPSSANTKSAYTELFSAIPFDVHGLSLDIRHVSGGISNLFDLAVGAAGSEQIVLENLHTTYFDAGQHRQVELPLRVPKGSRLAARFQTLSVATAPSHSIMAHLFSGDLGLAPVAEIIDTYGAATADSGGTQVDPGATIHTKGAWVEVAAATTREYRGFLLSFGQRGDSTLSDNRWLIDVGMGAAAAEFIIVPDIRLASSALDNFFQQFSPLFWKPIPAGSRVAVRAQSLINTAGNREFDVVLYGLR